MHRCASASGTATILARPEARRVPRNRNKHLMACAGVGACSSSDVGLGRQAALFFPFNAVIAFVNDDRGDVRNARAVYHSVLPAERCASGWLAGDRIDARRSRDLRAHRGVCATVRRKDVSPPRGLAARVASGPLLRRRTLRRSRWPPALRPRRVSGLCYCEGWHRGMLATGSVLGRASNSTPTSRSQ